LQISSVVAFDSSRTNAVAAVTNPGVQNPHCCASCLHDACCTAFICPAADAFDRVMARPSASTASIEHE